MKEIQYEIQNTLYDEILEFTNLDAFEKMVDQKREQKVNKDFKMSKLTAVLYIPQRRSNTSKKWKRKLRYFIPKDQFDFPGEILIFGNKVILTSLVPEYAAVVIKNESISKTLKSMFEVCFLGAKTFPQRKHHKQREDLNHQTQSTYESNPSVLSCTIMNHQTPKLQTIKVNHKRGQ